MNSRVQFLKDRVPRFQDDNCVCVLLDCLVDQFRLTKQYCELKLENVFNIAQATCPQKDGFALNLALCELIIFQGTGPGGFQVLCRL